MSEIIVMESQRQIADVTRDIRIKTSQFLLDAIEIGRLLMEAKALVPHGGWTQYVEEELPFSQSWANNYMRLFKEYGEMQLSLFGNSQATAKLSPTQALELLAIPAGEREEFIEAHDVEHMSTRELHQAIRERDKAVNAQREAEEALQMAETRADHHATRADKAEEENERLRSELSAAEDATAVATEKVQKLQMQFDAAKAHAKATEEALEKIKENPEIPEAVMEQMRQQVAADAAKEATEELQKKLEEAQAAADAAQKAKENVEQKLEAAKKEIKLANPDVAVLQATTKRFLEEFKAVQEQLEKVQQSDPETADKLKIAILGTIDRMRGMIAGKE